MEIVGMLKKAASGVLAIWPYSHTERILQMQILSFPLCKGGEGDLKAFPSARLRTGLDGPSGKTQGDRS
jgi:hypothetical protein